MQTPSDVTPLMRQYYAIKQQYSQYLLLFQVGDFYELFFDDAKKASAFLGIALTKRGKVNGDPIPLCGVPVHALDHYLAKLVKAGFKIAICDQLEEPKPGKVVERGVTHVLTPGTLTDSKLLDEKSASYLFSFFPLHNQWGLLFAELLTAQLFATVLSADNQKSLETELIRFFPDEIILPSHKEAKPFETYFKQLGYCTTIVSPDEEPGAMHWMQTQFSSDMYSQVCSHEAVRSSLSYFYYYLRQTQQSALDQFKSLHWYESDDYVILDRSTQSNLELLRNTHDGSKKQTLFEVLDGAVTPMGSRMIKKWIMRPLVKQNAIMQRHDVIGQLIQNIVIMQQLEHLLSDFGDIERVIGRIALRRATIGDYEHVRRVLDGIVQVHSILAPLKTLPLMTIIRTHIGDFSALCQLLHAALQEHPTKESIIKQGFDQELDYLKDIANNSSQKVLDLEAHEQKVTGINSLKIRFNTVHGYYIEVTKTHTDSIPARYIRQQTLVGRERYITPELQQLQHEIMRANNEMEQLEKAIFERLKQEVFLHIGALRKLAHALATLDALLGFARVSYTNRYVRPLFNETHDIIIADGRHPVVEQVLNHNFIPNDTCLNNEQSTWIITGPNMGGKSTYLRQVALINIMAQIGCFVPAKSAHLALVDRIFTRIGAGDNLAHGKSTFLVEMEETAAICTQATKRSLVILDEVGRGTSTFDGLAIAQAVVEYIHTNIKARCLFATHYQELTVLQNNYPGIVSFYAASKKTQHGIQFLYKVIKGVADGSFGVEVAQLAQLPPVVLARAKIILTQLQNHPVNNAVPVQSHNMHLHEAIEQLHAQLAHARKKIAALEQIDYDNLSPKAALDFLWKIKELR